MRHLDLITFMCRKALVEEHRGKLSLDNLLRENHKKKGTSKVR